MSDGRIRSGRHKGDSLINIIAEEVELNTKAGDTNLCFMCKDVIDSAFYNGHRDRTNRIDCEDEDGDLISYHLECYRKAMYESR